MPRELLRGTRPKSATGPFSGFIIAKGVTAKDIAALPGIGLSPKGVESLIFRLTRLVRNVVNTSPQTDPRESEGEKGSALRIFVLRGEAV